MCPLKRAKKEKGRKEVVVVVVRIIVNNNLNTEVFVGKEGKKGECDDYSIPYMIGSILSLEVKELGQDSEALTGKKKKSKAILDTRVERYKDHLFSILFASITFKVEHHSLSYTQTSQSDSFSNIFSDSSSFVSTSSSSEETFLIVLFVSFCFFGVFSFSSGCSRLYSPIFSL